MGTLYVDTGGNASNSGSTDTNSPTVSGSAATVAASVVTLDGSPDLSATVTSGATQSTIYLNDATNSNMKLFWITAFDNTLKTVTVSVAPTGVTSSAWRIGGRMVWTPANVESALRPNDDVIFNNSPAARTTSFYTHRVAGTTAGYIRLKGKAGVRPVFNVTNTFDVINQNGIASLWIENIEIDQDGATGYAILGGGGTLVVVNVKISDCGGIGIEYGGNGGLCAFNEISGTGGVAISSSGAVTPMIYGNYIHDCGSDGLVFSSSDISPQILWNIIDTCAGRGIYLSGGSTSGLGGRCVIDHNTIYGCGNSGLEITDADTAINQITNNIFSENGNAAGEYNFEMVAGTFELKGYHSHNIFFHSGGGGGANLLGLTANATEFTTDPLFTDAAGGDFSISSTSPGKGAARGIGVTGLGYADIGAVQRQEPASGGMLVHPGMNGRLQ